MPAVSMKTLLIRRTLATSGINPPPINGGSACSSGVKRCTLANLKKKGVVVGGAGLRVCSAHVSNKNILLPFNNNNNNSSSKSNNNNNNIYTLFPTHNNNKYKHIYNYHNYYYYYYSSFSSTSSSPEREKLSSIKNIVSSNNNSIVGEMGAKRNGADLRENGGAVSSSNDKDHKEEEEEEEEECTKLLTLPTVLTLARVAAIPIFIATFYVNSWWGTAATTSIFIAAAITDWLDGYLARKMRLGTAFGAFLDPVADKLMVAATLVLLCSRPPETALFGDAPWLFPVPAIAIIGREITMSAVREWAASQNTKLLQAVAVNNLGKWKTATQMTALMILLATRDNSLAGQGALVTSGVALLYVSAGLAVWSLVVYMKKISKVLLR